MKDSFRISGMIILIAIYCFTVSTITNLPVSYDYENHQTTEQEQYLTTISYNLFYHASQLENLVKKINNLPVTNLKKTFDKLWSIIKPIERLFQVRFTQYSSFSINFLIQYRKTDIIFPFLYFW